MKVKSESEVAQLCSTLSKPTDCSPPGSSVHGIFQATVLEWGAIAFSRSTCYMFTYFFEEKFDNAWNKAHPTKIRKAKFLVKSW